MAAQSAVVPANDQVSFAEPATARVIDRLQVGTRSRCTFLEGGGVWRRRSDGFL